MRNIIVRLIAFLGVLCAVSTAAATEKAAIRLGMSAAFTGTSRALGLGLYKGAMSYFAQVNKKGGIKGHQIVLVTYDDGYNPEPMVKNTIRFIEEDRILALFGYVGTPTTTRMLPLLQRYSGEHVLLLFPFSGSQLLREKPYCEDVFNLRGSYVQETKGLVDKFVAIGRRKIGIFYQIDAYGRSGWDGVRKALAQYNLQINGEATYRRGVTFADSMTRQVSILQGFKPDAIISIGSYAACGAFIRDARNDGWDVPIANLSFANSDKLVEQLNGLAGQKQTQLLENLISTQVVPNYKDDSLPVVREYRQAMAQAGNTYPLYGDGIEENQQYGYISFEGYLNARLLCTALAKMADPTDRVALKQVLESMGSVDLGIGASVRFGPGQHQGLNEIYFTTVRDGRVVDMRDEDWERMAK